MFVLPNLLEPSGNWMGKKKKKLFIHFCSSICNFHYFLVDVCIFQFLGIALLCLIHSLLWFPETGTYELALNVLSD